MSNSLTQPEDLPPATGARLESLGTRCPFTLQQVTIAERAIRLARVDCVEDLLDELATRDADDPELQDEKLPYWAHLWPSSIALAELILQHPTLVAGREVVELGCGQGLAGVAAGLAGAQVCLTDYHDDALAFAASNWQLNLDDTPSVLQVDWREPAPPVLANVVLAADVLYEKRFFAPFLRTARQIMDADGTLILAEPNRDIARPLLAGLPAEWSILDRWHVRVEEPIQTAVTIYLLQPNKD